MPDCSDRQLSLLDWRPTPAQERKFSEYDAANPQIWRMFQQFAFDRIARGYANFSSRDIVHRIRWETGVADDEAAFKINDHWSPWFARKFHRSHPEHNGFFRTRHAKADSERKAA